MPWRETSPMDQRMRFVLEYETGLFTMTELAEQYAITRKTGHKWVSRYRVTGVTGLLEHSRRPHRSPSATDTAIVEALVAVRQKHPQWGPRKLVSVLATQYPHTAWPSRSTVAQLLKARGLVRERRRRARRSGEPVALAHLDAANAVWTTDFKGEFRTGDGRYCYPLTLRDGFSRYVLRCDALLSPGYAATRRRFERAFVDYGLPERIRSDNGSLFASTGLGRLSRLAVWWIRLGILPERIAPAHPEQNGSHEQFHSVLKQATARPPAATAAAQQRRFMRFCTEYNHERPHEALHDRPPATSYTPSVRPWPRRVPPLEYPGHVEVRRVSAIGQVSWRGRLWFVSSALAGEDVAFEEVADGFWTVYFASVALGRLDERRRRIQPITPFTRGRSAASPPRA